MKCNADGQLKHHFWGEYKATMVLVFDNEQMLAAALNTNNFPTWKKSNTNSTAIIWFGSSDELDVEIEKLVSYGAKREKIASIAKSIDFGEPFKISFEAKDPRQIEMF